MISEYVPLYYSILHNIGLHNYLKLNTFQNRMKRNKILFETYVIRNKCIPNYINVPNDYCKFNNKVFYIIFHMLCSRDIKKAIVLNWQSGLY